jgi:hypothetical protein
MGKLSSDEQLGETLNTVLRHAKDVVFLSAALLLTCTGGTLVCVGNLMRVGADALYEKNPGLFKFGKKSDSSTGDESQPDIAKEPAVKVDPLADIKDAPKSEAQPDLGTETQREEPLSKVDLGSELAEEAATTITQKPGDTPQ